MKSSHREEAKEEAVEEKPLSEDSILEPQVEEIESHPETVSVRNDPASSRRSQTQQEAPVEDKPLSSAPQEYVKSQDDEVPTPYKEEIQESQKDAQNVETPILAELIVDSGERGILD